MQITFAIIENVHSCIGSISPRLAFLSASSRFLCSSSGLYLLTSIAIVQIIVIRCPTFSFSALLLTANPAAAPALARLPKLGSL